MKIPFMSLSRRLMLSMLAGLIWDVLQPWKRWDYVLPLLKLKGGGYLVSEEIKSTL